MYRKLSFIFYIILLAAGCVKEDRGGCPVGIPMKFSYTLNESGKEALSTYVKTIRVYVFDRQTGLLANVIDVGSASIAKGSAYADLPDGRYTMIAWAGGGSDLTAGGFHDGQASSYTTPDAFPPAKIGTTTLSDFRMMLDTNPAAGTVSFIPKIKQFEDLFYATAGDVTVSGGKASPEVKFDFVKNSSLLDIRISGLHYLTRATTSPRVFVTGSNGLLLSNDNIDSNAQNIRYEPYSETSNEDTMNVLIKTLRLDLGRESGMPVLLYVQNAVNGQNIINPPLNVVTLIRRIRDEQGKNLYDSQADIDREDKFVIEIELSGSGKDLSVKITVNGFETVTLIPA